MLCAMLWNWSWGVTDREIEEQTLYPQGACPNGDLQPAAQPFYQCFSYYSYPCCSPQDTYTIQSAFASSLYALYHDCPGCMENLNELICAGTCSPYITRFRQSSTLLITPKACDRLFTSCKDTSPPTGTSLKAIYRNSKEFCESDMGVPFFTLKVDKSGWDGALLSTCRLESVPYPGLSDHNSDFDDWSLRISLSETLMEQFGRDSVASEATLRAVMLDTARFVGIVYDGKTAEGIEEMMWDVVRFGYEKELGKEWSRV